MDQPYQAALKKVNEINIGQLFYPDDPNQSNQLVNTLSSKATTQFLLQQAQKHLGKVEFETAKNKSPADMTDYLISQLKTRIPNFDDQLTSFVLEYKLRFFINILLHLRLARSESHALKQINSSILSDQLFSIQASRLSPDTLRNIA